MKDKILIVEDVEEDFKTFLGIVHSDFDVLPESKFDKYVIYKLIEENDIKAVILDLYEKDKKGNELEKGLKLLNDIRDIYLPFELPVIIHTTHSKAHLNIAVKCLQAGAQDWIWKDINLMGSEEKIARIKGAIGISKYDAGKQFVMSGKMKKREFIYLVSNYITITISLLLIYFIGYKGNNMILGGALPGALILSQMIASRLAKKISIVYNFKEAQLSAEIQGYDKT